MIPENQTEGIKVFVSLPLRRATKFPGLFGTGF
jgi:hypothetical protein